MNKKLLESCAEPAALRRALLALLPALALGETARAQSRDPALLQPASFRVALENRQLRVLEYRALPGLGVCGKGMHSHPAHLTVALTPGRVRVRAAGGRFEEKTIEAGAVWWSEAETHEVENISGRESRALLIELKTG